MGAIIKIQLTDVQIQEKLNAAFFKWVKENDKINQVVEDHGRLLTYTGKSIIEIDMRQFNETYIQKYFISNKEVFCDLMIKSLEKMMLKTLCELEPIDYKFKFEFRYWGIHLSRTVNYYFLSKIS